MIYVTADPHGDCSNIINFARNNNLTTNDSIIIAGDASFLFEKRANMKELLMLHKLKKVACKILFIDGNHENFDRLNSYPQKEWNGGLVHMITPNLIHLLRGQLYSLEGMTIFTFGGAFPHEKCIILDPKSLGYVEEVKRCEKENIYYRVKGIDYWNEQIPSEDEMVEGWSNLEKSGYQVDYIITHSAPVSVEKIIYRQDNLEVDRLSDYLEKIRNKVTYRKWICGHYHITKKIDEKFQIVNQNDFMKLNTSIK